jgi:hypothetical protein
VRDPRQKSETRKKPEKKRIHFFILSLHGNG